MTEVPADWPGRATSCSIRCPPHDWHVQLSGAGPDLLLLHGAGASGHSFRALLPCLPGFRRIVPDLPGQGFTRPGAARFGLDAMAADLAALCRQEGWQPAVILGHSAGAAVALRLAETLSRPPCAVVGINAALGPFEGFAGWLFPKIAQAMTVSPFVSQLVTRIASQRRRVERLLRGTGSRIDSAGIELYRRLLARPQHVQGTLGMMAAWDLDPLLRRLPEISVPVMLIAATGDVTVPPEVSRRAAARLPACEYVELPALGHLAHEEAPATVAAHAMPFIARELSRQSRASGFPAG